MTVTGMDLSTAAISWDQDGQRFYETGTRMGVLYKKEGATYGVGVPWNGLTAVSESPSGAEETALWADDIKYLSLRSSEQFGGTIEAYTYPDEWEECDGSASLATGVVVGQQTRKPFGLCYRTIVGNDTDNDQYGYKIHLVYNAMASTSQKSYATVNDSPEAITFSWEFTTTPHKINSITIGNETKTFKPSATLIIDAAKLASTTAGRAALVSIEKKLYGCYEAKENLATFTTGVDYYTKDNNGAYQKVTSTTGTPDSNTTYYEYTAPTLLMPDQVLSIVNPSA